MKLKLLFQQNNQSVGNLVAHLETLKQQLNSRLTEQQPHQNLFCVIHKYIWDALIWHKKVGKTKEKLKEAACSMELVQPASENITV